MADNSITKDPPPKRLVKEWLSGGLANAFASACLNPFDVAKTRAQLTNANLTTAMRSMYLEGGIIGLWTPGLTASCIRELLSSGPRAGFYVPVRRHLSQLLDKENKETSFAVKCLAAMTTGTLGSIIANPIDVVKIRMQFNPQRYHSVIAAFPQIIHQEGVVGLYKGVLPSTLRGAFIAAGELATYDHAKHLLKTMAIGYEEYLIIEEGFLLHSMASFVTGFVAATVAAPFDIVKTRTMNSTTLQRPSHILWSIVEKEGIRTLFRGWLPSYLRLGPHAMICFPVFEKLRFILGLDYL